MTNASLPPHLERVGGQLTTAAHDLASAPRRSRRRPLQLLLASTTALAAIAAAAVLTVGATTGTPPAFAVTRHHDGTVSVRINRRVSIAEVNRKLAAMGIEKIGRGPTATRADMSSIPSCSSIPAGWKGVWVQFTGSTSGPGYSVITTTPPGTWIHIECLAVNTGPASSRTTGNTGAG